MGARPFFVQIKHRLPETQEQSGQDFRPDQRENIFRIPVLRPVDGCLLFRQQGCCQADCITFIRYGEGDLFVLILRRR